MLNSSNTAKPLGQGISDILDACKQEKSSPPLSKGFGNSLDDFFCDGGSSNSKSSVIVSFTSLSYTISLPVVEGLPAGQSSSGLTTLVTSVGTRGNINSQKKEAQTDSPHLSIPIGPEGMHR